MSHSLVIEPFYVGSHKQLVDLLVREIPGVELATLRGKKWHWKARTSALSLSQQIKKDHCYKTVFASSVLNLAELVALRPDLACCKTVLYFHENQLVYPVREQKDRDFQYGYNQILSSMVADTVLFNSQYNMDSFLNNIHSFLKLIPDHRPKNLADQIRPKCHVLNFPIVFPARMLKQDHPPVHKKHLHDQSGKMMPKGCMPAEVCNINLQLVEPHTVCQPVNYSDEVVMKNSKSHAEFSDTDQLCASSNAGVSKKSRKKAKKGGIKAELPSVDDNRNQSAEVHLTYNETECFVKDEINNGTDANETEYVDKNEKQCETYTVSAADGGITDVCSSVQPDTITAVGETPDAVLTAEKVITKMKAKKKQKKNDSAQLCPKCLRNESKLPLHIVWPHRWEHDKGPELFLQTVQRLHYEGVDFELSVVGETFTEVPAIFEQTRQLLGNKINFWGYQPSKHHYYQVLRSADCVVSTALHEFYGVAMLEAVHLGCYPLCPNRLVYPEIFPKECLYKTDQQLFKRLRHFCRYPEMVRNSTFQFSTDRFSWAALQEEYKKYLQETN